MNHGVFQRLMSHDHVMRRRVPIWPKLAAWFGNEAGPPLKIPLKTLLSKHEKTWSAIQA